MLLDFPYFFFFFFLTDLFIVHFCLPGCAPPPGTYELKPDDVKGAASFHKAERFRLQKRKRSAAGLVPVVVIRTDSFLQIVPHDFPAACPVR